MVARFPSPFGLGPLSDKTRVCLIVLHLARSAVDQLLNRRVWRIGGVCEVIGGGVASIGGVLAEC